MQKKLLRLRLGDALAVLGILALAVAVFLLFLPRNTTDDLSAQIYVDGKLVNIISLEIDQEFVVTNRYSNTITVRDGAIAVTASDCPGEDCLHCGWIRGSGKSIVCLPNGLEIRIVAESSDVDFVVG